MSFTIDEETLDIRGRRGDSASFTFEFENNLTGLSIDFEVKKNMGTNEAIVTKSFSNITNNTVIVNLSTDDTKKFTVPIGSYGTYYWGLKIYSGTDFAQTLIPDELENPPLFLVYPEIVGK